MTTQVIKLIQNTENMNQDQCDQLAKQKQKPYV